MKRGPGRSQSPAGIAGVAGGGDAVGWPHPSAPTLEWRGGPPGDVDVMGCELGTSLATWGSSNCKSIYQPLCCHPLPLISREQTLLWAPSGIPTFGTHRQPLLTLVSSPTLPFPSPLLRQCCCTVPGTPNDPEPVGLMDNPALQHSPAALAGRRCRNLCRAGTSSPLIPGRPIRAAVPGCAGWC